MKQIIQFVLNFFIDWDYRVVFSVYLLMLTRPKIVNDVRLCTGVGKRLNSSWLKIFKSTYSTNLLVNPALKTVKTCVNKINIQI